MAVIVMEPRKTLRFKYKKMINDQVLGTKVKQKQVKKLV